MNDILTLLNTKAGRHLFNIKDTYPIVKITPNSIHQLLEYKNGKATFQAKFWSINAVTITLAPILEKVAIAKQSNWKIFRRIQENPYKAFLHYSALERYNFPTIYLTSYSQNITGGTGANDSLGIEANATWAGAHGGSTATALNASPLEGTATKINVSSWTVFRFGIYFDTTSIPSNATVSAADIQLKTTLATISNADSGNIDIVSFTPSTPATLAVGDYNKFGTTLYATSKAVSSLSTGTYYTWNLNATGISAIALAAKSNWGVRNSLDTTNTTPSGTNRVAFHDATDGSAEDPIMDATYTIPSSITGGEFLTWI